MNKRSLLAGVAAFAVGTLVHGAAMADPIELKFFDRFTSAGQTDFSKWLVDSFNEAHADKVHVTWGGIQDEGFKPKINAVLRAPDAPDVFYSWEGGWAKYMIDSGYAAPLNEYYEKYGWAKTMSPAGLKLATFDGTQYFVPTMMSASIVWYRPDIFQKIGISAPATWDEFLADAEKIKAAGIAPTILANQQRWPAQFLWSGIFVNKNGVDVYDQLIGRKIAWTDPRVVDAFQQMKDLADKGYFEEGANGLDVTPAVIPFAEGKAATWYQGTFMIPSFVDEKGEPKFPLDFFAMPKIGDKAPTVSVFAENTLMLNANSKNKDAAAEFLDYAISKKAQTEQALGQAKLLYASNIGVDMSSLPPLTKKIGELIAGYQQSTFMHVDHAVSPAVSDPYLEVLQSVIIGNMTPAQAAEETEKAAEGDQGPVKP
jgi:raffinose/stachyose/melibiose transport system substrate-binding protein